MSASKSSVSTFFTAVRKGHVGTVSSMLAVDPSLARHTRNSVSSVEDSALLVATREGHSACVRLLLPHSDLSMVDASGQTPLMIAAIHGHLDCLTALLPHVDANVVWKVSASVNALMLAARMGHVACVQALLDATDLNTTGNDALNESIDGGNAQCVTLLVPRFPRERFFKRDASGDTPLMRAVHQGNAQIVAFLAPYSDVNATNKQGDTLLICAAKANTQSLAPILRTLLPHCDPRARSGDGETALMWAVQQTLPPGDMREAIRLLLACDARAVNHYAETALMLAVQNNNTVAIEVLLPHSDLLAQDQNANDAVDHAFFNYKRNADLDALRCLDLLAVHLDGKRVAALVKQVQRNHRACIPHCLAVVERQKLERALLAPSAPSALPTSTGALPAGADPTASGSTPARPVVARRASRL